MGLARTVRRRLLGILVVLFSLTVTLPVLAIAAYRYLPVPATPLMVIRAVEDGAWPARDWVTLDEVPREVLGAIVAAEDNNFCTHHGVDWGAVRDAYEEWEAGGSLRGASTVSMQVARNLFLWDGGGAIRKGMEVYLTAMVEALLPKRRILEIYVNIAEWGPGVFGIEAAAQHHFGVSARQLTPRQAAALVAILPAPRVWSPNQPTARAAARIGIVTARMPAGMSRLACLES